VLPPGINGRELKVVFAGTPSFAARSLAAIVQSRHRVVAVLTQPDRPAGRGLFASASPVKALAMANGLAVMQPPSLRDDAVQSLLRSLQPDIMVVAAYGLILPQAVLDIPRRGGINVHASLLPRWRGAAPIQRALLAGDARTGISIMQMDAGLDTGPVLTQKGFDIGDDDTAGTLHDRLAELGAAMCVATLDAFDSGKLVATPQSERDATYAPKIGKAEARIDWREGAALVQRRVRAFNPTPGASSSVRGAELKFWACSLAEGRGSPGEVLDASDGGLLIACGEGAVLATELQRAGGKRLRAGELLRGFALSRGERFAAVGP
jgi:methionyl-tRNA formyltransferase